MLKLKCILPDGGQCDASLLSAINIRDFALLNIKIKKGVVHFVGNRYGIVTGLSLVIKVYARFSEILKDALIEGIHRLKFHSEMNLCGNTLIE